MPCLSLSRNMCGNVVVKLAATATALPVEPERPLQVAVTVAVIVRRAVAIEKARKTPHLKRTREAEGVGDTISDLAIVKRDDVAAGHGSSPFL